MLVHGFGEDHSIWSNQINLLSESYLVIAPDIPGSGKSEMLNGHNVGMDSYAACLKQICTQEGIENLIMIGHSMGGYITLAFLEKYRKDLRALGLFHSTSFADSEEKKQSRLKAIEFIETNGASAFLKTSIPGLLFDEEKNAADIKALLHKGKGFTSEALVQYYRAMIARLDRSELLKNSLIPVLFMAGKHDKAVPFSDSLQQAHYSPVCHFHVLKESGHMGMWEEVQLSNEILANFLHSIDH